MQYKSVSSILTTLESKAELYFFDIEETILGCNINYEIVSFPYFKDLFDKITAHLDEQVIKQVKHVGKNFRRQLIEDCTPSVIKKLKSQKKKVFALTSGCPSKHKKDKLIEMGVRFHGYLWTRGMPKGPFLINFLEDKGLTGKCCFLDNDLNKVMSVSRAFTEKYQDTREIDLLLFDRKVTHEISQASFIEYWNAVISHILSGKFQNTNRKSSYKSKKYIK